MEPIDGPVRVPEGGWPRALQRMDLLPGIKLDVAIYEIAGASRRLHRGVVADFIGVPLVAFPHQTTDEVAATYGRLREAMYAFDREGVPERWSSARKAWICAGVMSGATSPAEIDERFGIGSDELAEWLKRFSTFGLPGLSARPKIAAVR